MTLRQKTYSGAADLRAMTALVHAFPERHPHVVDLPYRLCSWGLDEPHNVGLWTNAAGELRGWAVMQTPFWCIDIVPHPDDEAEYPRLLAWAEQRAAALRGGAYGRPLWFVNVLARQQRLQRSLEVAGFAPQTHVPVNPLSSVVMQLQGEPKRGETPPDGIIIRPLAGEAEVAAYVACHQAAFGSDSMRAGWRARTLRHSAYRPELDLVAVTPDGRLAGLCVCWLSAFGGQVEPLGVHPDFRGQGLGRALLLAGIRRLRDLGAARVLVHTDHQRDAAFALYQAVGFRVVENVWVYRKDWP